MTQQQDQRRTASGHKVGEVIDYGWAGAKPQPQIVVPVEGGDWIVVQSEHRQERTAEEALRDKGFETYLPQYEATVKRSKQKALSKRGATERVKRVLFPSYLFLRTMIASGEWKRAFSCLGVHGLLCAGDAPMRVPEREIAKLMGLPNCGVSETSLLPFREGQDVKVEAGPFTGFDAVVEQIHAGKVDAAMAVTCLLSLFGREVRITLSADALRRL